MVVNKNLIWQFLGQGMGKIFTLFFYILLPRTIGLQNYGEFAFVYSFSSLSFQPFVEMGLDIQITKWVSEKKFQVLHKILLLRTGVALFASIINIILALVFSIPLNILILVLIYFFFANLQTAFFGFFRGLEEMKYEGVITPIQKLSSLLLLLIFSQSDFNGGLLAALCLSLSTIPGLLFLIFKYFRLFFQNQVKFSNPKFLELKLSQPISYKQIIQRAMIMGVASLLWLMYFKIDSVMLGFLTNNNETGVYNLAYKLMEAPIFVPSIIMIVFFPKLTKPEQFNQIFSRLLLFLPPISCLVAAVFYWQADLIINLIYGMEFSASIPVLQALSLALIPLYLGQLTTQSLIALDLNHQYLRIILMGTIFNIVLNYLLIPDFGAFGAASATIATEILVMFFCGYFVWKTKPNAFSFYNFRKP